jgi:hypothetical protein
VLSFNLVCVSTLSVSSSFSKILLVIFVIFCKKYKTFEEINGENLNSNECISKQKKRTKQTFYFSSLIVFVVVVFCRGKVGE